MREEIRSFGVFQIIVLVLSVYAFGALILDTFFTLNPRLSYILQLFDYVVCAVFFWDFLRQLRVAENKLYYLRTWGWVDLLASVPTVDFLRWARVFRVIRILRILRAVLGTHKLWQLFRARQALGGSVALSAFFLILLSTLAMLYLENSEKSNIRTAGDALWWTLTTITTVGYGDLYPVTAAGRIVAALLMVGGVGLFGSFTALVASYFTGRNDSNASTSVPQSDLLREIQTLRLEIQALRERLDTQPRG